MIITRRRRWNEADRYLRSVLGDAAISAWYDTRFPWTIAASSNLVSAWADARGTVGTGPTLTAATTQRPTWSPSAQTLTFDGTANRLRYAGAWSVGITAAGAVVIVGVAPATGAGAERLATLGVDASARVIGVQRASGNGNFQVLAAATAGVTCPSGTRVFHGWRTASSGGNVSAGARVGGGAADLQAAAESDVAANSFSLASDGTGASTFADIVVRAVLIIKGTYTTAQQNAVNEWARAVHGATI